MMVDADTVITGPVLDKVKEVQADFIVDRGCSAGKNLGSFIMILWP